MTGIILQILTGTFGAVAVWMISRKADWARYGYILGFISQFFWLALFFHYKQYFMIPTLLIYGYAWCSGFYLHWIKK